MNEGQSKIFSKRPKRWNLKLKFGNDQINASSNINSNQYDEIKNQPNRIKLLLRIKKIMKKHTHRHRKIYVSNFSKVQLIWCFYHLWCQISDIKMKTNVCDHWFYLLKLNKAAPSIFLIQTTYFRFYFVIIEKKNACFSFHI